jgi:hypothetical protein
MLVSFLFIYGTGVEPAPILLRSFIGVLYQPWMADGDDCGAISGMNEYSKKTRPSAALYNKDPK